MLQKDEADQKNCKVIHITVADFKRFKKIRLLSLEKDPDAFGTTLEDALTWDEKNWRSQVERLTTFIGVLDDKDVGVVRVVKDEKDINTAWLISMWVSKEARGRGVAQKLIEATINWCRANSVKTLKLDVADFNDPAISLYNKLGFRRNGVLGSLPAPRTHITEHQRELRVME